MNNYTKKFIKETASQYGVSTVIFVKPGDKYCQANGIKAYVDHSYLIGGDEIQIGIYKNKQWMLISFFHEIGHLLVDGEALNYDKFKIEKSAWDKGLEVAASLGCNFSRRTLSWAKEQCDSYINYG